MKTKKQLFTKDTPKPRGPYSQAIIYNDLVFISGQGSVDPKTNEILRGSIEEETNLTLENIKTILLAAGSCLSNALKVTVYLGNMEDFERVNKIYEKYLGGNSHEIPPARSCIEAGRLSSGIKVEIDVIAYLDDRGD